MLSKDQSMLDEQARWEFVLEVERYHRKLRSLECVESEIPMELYRNASQEHLERVTSIYAQAGQRQRQHGDTLASSSQAYTQ